MNDAGANKAVSLYNDIKETWDSTIQKVRGIENILTWSTLLINTIMIVLKMHNIIKIQLYISNYPEVVPALFPNQFVPSYVIKTKHCFIYRFGISFLLIENFLYFDEFFDRECVNYMKNYMPEVYFSNLILNDGTIL
ncbi:hypothetical protein COBT_001029 [Conglomerata obtusa]